MASDIKSIIRTAHMHDIPVIADEAHGAHMMFRDDFPLTAMEAGADMSAVSVHKTAGSLTQSSVLLSGGRSDPEGKDQTIAESHIHLQCLIPSHVFTGYSQETACHKGSRIAGESAWTCQMGQR